MRHLAACVYIAAVVCDFLSQFAERGQRMLQARQTSAKEKSRDCMALSQESCTGRAGVRTKFCGVVMREKMRLCMRLSGTLLMP